MFIPDDKKKYFMAGVVIAALFSMIAGYVCGFLAAITAVAFKETYDKLRGKGTPELLDFIATAAGAITAIVMSVAASCLWEAIQIST